MERAEGRGISIDLRSAIMFQQVVCREGGVAAGVLGRMRMVEVAERGGITIWCYADA